jgi:hypothetical protein
MIRSASLPGAALILCAAMAVILAAPVAKSAAQTSVYLGRVWSDAHRKGIIVEDYVVWKRYEKRFEKDGLGVWYDDYMDSLRNTVQRYLPYADTINAYYFDTDRREFPAWTTLHSGEAFHVAAPGVLRAGKLHGAAVIFDEAIGTGAVFHPFLELADTTSLVEGDMAVCVRGAKPGPMVNAAPPDAALRDILTRTLLPKVRKLKRQDWDSGKKIAIRDFRDEELTVIPGSFTAPGAREFLVTLLIRYSYDAFITAVYVMSPEGNILATVAPFARNAFTYNRADAALDCDGDGLMEVLLHSGYYEGGGYALMKRSNGKYVEIASGFYFGV